MPNGNSIPLFSEITGKIMSVMVVKQGVTNNNSWSLYEVTINGEKFRTFDAGYNNLINQQGTYKFKEEIVTGNDGRQYKRRTLNSITAPGLKPISQQILPITKEDVTEIKNKINQIIGMLQGPGSDQAGDYEDDPGPGDIPQ